MHVIVFPNKKVVLTDWRLETDGKSVFLYRKKKLVHTFKDSKTVRCAIFIHLFYNANNYCSYEEIYKTSYNPKYPPQGKRSKVNQGIQRQINHLRLELKGLPMSIETWHGAKLNIEDKQKVVVMG